MADSLRGARIPLRSCNQLAIYRSDSMLTKANHLAGLRRLIFDGCIICTNIIVMREDHVGVDTFDQARHVVLCSSCIAD